MSPPWQVARCASDDVGCGPVTIRGSHGGWHEPSETGTGVALLAARPIAVSDPPRHVAGDSVHVVGVSAYLTKDRAPEELLAAIRSVLQGKRYLSETVALELADHVALAGSGSEPPHELLSPREYEVLVLLASARSVSEIAARLDLSVKTVSTLSSRESACGRRWRACRDLRALRLASRRAPQGTAGHHAPGVLRTGHGHGVVAIACHLLGLRELAVVLSWINLVAYPARRGEAEDGMSTRHRASVVAAGACLWAAGRPEGAVATLAEL